MGISKFLSGALRNIYGLTKKTQTDNLTKNSLKKRSRTIVFGIHGTLQVYYLTFYAMARYFAGKDFVFVPVEYNYREPLRIAAKKISIFIKETLRKGDFYTLIFLGHSYGGIVARYVVKAHFQDTGSTAGNIKIITLSTPHAGIDLKKCTIFGRALYWFLGTQAPETRNNEVLNYLNQHPLKCQKAKPSKTKFLTVLRNLRFLTFLSMLKNHKPHRL